MTKFLATRFFSKNKTSMELEPTQNLLIAQMYFPQPSQRKIQITTNKKHASTIVLSMWMVEILIMVVRLCLGWRLLSLF